MENYTFWYHHGERRCESDSESEELEKVIGDEEVKETIQDFEYESEELEVVGDDGVREMIKDLYHGRIGNEFGGDSSNYEVHE
ncbi:hypothetical protein Scep_007242 [Stephania cephalantha]|uniref:Uncharacterized protein n=1 Tax=Stephania cephalantha TaxID=152367 RepID=A0AAP0KC66_9MAGN